MTDKKEVKNENDLLEQRKEKVIKVLKVNYNWIFYVMLAVIVFLTVKLRTLNVSKLKDVTTGDWTLGPDLDPFLFLRWSKYIVENGSLFSIDQMRYVPLFYKTNAELLLHPYMMAWFHNIATFFGSDSVTLSAIYYPVFFFAITVIAFFFLVRKIFLDSLGVKKANVIAIISSFFFAVIPIFLPRTIAGIPEKEAAAFFFIFIAFYAFLSAWKSNANKKAYAFAVLAGAATACAALVWGGYAFIFLTIGPAVFIAFLLGKTNKQKIIVYIIWLLSSFILMYPFSSRYGIGSLTQTTQTASAIIVLVIILLHYVLFGTKLKHQLRLEKWNKIPDQIKTTIIAMIAISILATILFGLSYIPSQIVYLVDNLVRPATTRLIQTVAENRQPFFTEWGGSFGPVIRNIPIYFWLFFIGSIYLVYFMTSKFAKKERIIISATYTLFFFGMIFSRYDGNSTLNGSNFTSLGLYALGFILFVGSLAYYYFQKNKTEEGRETLKSIHFELILLLVLFLMTAVAARGSVRLVMLLVPPGAILASYLVVAVFSDSQKIKDNSTKLAGYAITAIIIISLVYSGDVFYNQSKGEAANYAPSVYTQQWQKAMAYVRDNTNKNAVFGHWWDYGYWVQSIGERATVLDGGNAISYWNHMMGRYALTGTDNFQALEFLYAHNTTHFLIDSTDIGKYSAFSSIGSDTNYDRASFIPTYLKDDSATQEGKNSTSYFYTGGAPLDEDIIYNQDGKEILLPSSRAGLGAIIIERNSAGEIISQPKGIFIYQNQQVTLPLRYAFDVELVDYGSGVDVGVYIFPAVNQNAVDPNGAILYLSRRTVKSQLTRLYIYRENNPYFKLVHSEDDYIVQVIREQNPAFKGDIVYYNGVRGPIRIWEISYPRNIEFKQEYLSTLYPKELDIAR